MTEVVCGTLLGLGLWVLVGGGGQTSLTDRLVPHLRDVGGTVRGTSPTRDIADFLLALWPHPFRIVKALWDSRPSARRKLVGAELPAFLDRAAVCLAAGLPLGSMFERLGENATGIIGTESAAIARDMALGISLVDACTASEQRVRHESWSRLIEHLMGASRQGTPISDIVRSLATDERAAASRALIEAAAAREIWMLLPLVFVILPMTILVAVFPGLIALGSLPV